MAHSPSPTEPALKPPLGVPAEFYNPYTLQPYEALEIAASIILTTVMVFARLYTKKYIVKALKWEDYTCFFGWATFMGYLAIEYSIGTHGGGTHMWNLHESSAQFQRKYNNYSDPVYSLAILGTKTSILLLILRVFCSTRRDLGYWLTIGLVVANGIFYIVFFFIPIFLCSPRDKIWIPEKPGRCLNKDALYMASAAFNMVSDLTMLSVPIWLIWNLQMSLRRKIGVSAIFATGGLACISSILRLVYHAILLKRQDYSFINFQAALWAIAEIAFGLLCSCLVVLPRLFQHLAAIAPSRARGESATFPAATSSEPLHSRQDWIKLQRRKDQSSPDSLPLKTNGDVLECAIEGKPTDQERGF